MGSLDADTVGLLAASEGQPLALALQALAATGTLPAVMDTTIDNGPSISLSNKTCYLLPFRMPSFLSIPAGLS